MQSTVVSPAVTGEIPVSVASPDDLLAAGKARRDAVPREAHGDWKPAPSRDPLAILRAADANRLPDLVPIRYGRMLESPFAFYRGAAGVMAADLAQTPVTGFTVQACGDCHLKNFGGFATPERNIVFDINDFDETLPGPWEWDVKRLTASFALAARANGLGDDVAREAVMTCARSYRKSVREFASMSSLDLWYLRFGLDDIISILPDAQAKARVERRVKKAQGQRGSSADYPKLAQSVHGQIHIRDHPPLIFHPWETREAGFRELALSMMKEYRSTLPHERRVLLDRYEFVDAAMKVVGVGSVGTRCWVVLLMSVANEPLFLQIKQAGESVLEPFVGKSEYENAGQRVVVGQRLMQAASDIFLGWMKGPAGDFYVRQLRDAKISPLVEEFDAPMLTAYALACGRNLARAHAKTGDAWKIGGYLGKSAVFDEAIGQFAIAYADQSVKDHAALEQAVKNGTIEARRE